MDENKFYEKKFTYTQRWNKKVYLASLIYLKLIRLKLFNRYITSTKTKKILDMGCGGGNELFSKKGQVFGIDISNSSVREAAKVYKFSKVASSTATGFEADYFDHVVSSDLLGHLDPQAKTLTIEECFRVLKPGGTSLHYIELDCNNIFYRFAKRFPNLYQKYFIVQDGHINLETIDQNEKEFLGAGFKIVKSVPLYKFSMSSDEFLKRFDNEYKDLNFFVRIAVGWSRFLVKFRPIGIICDLVGGWIGEFIGLALNNSCAGGLFLIVRKPRP